MEEMNYRKAYCLLFNRLTDFADDLIEMKLKIDKIQQEAEEIITDETPDDSRVPIDYVLEILTNAAKEISEKNL